MPTMYESFAVPLIQRGALSDGSDVIELLRLLYEELELRIGAAISNTLSEAELEEFEQLAEARSGEAGIQWLASNVPEHPRIVTEVRLALIEEAVELSRTRDLTTLQSWPVRTPYGASDVAVALWVRGFRPDGADLSSLADQIVQRAAASVSAELEGALDMEARRELAELRVAIGAGQLPSSVEREWFDRLRPDSEGQRFGVIRDLVNQVLDNYHHGGRLDPKPDSDPATSRATPAEE